MNDDLVGMVDNGVSRIFKLIRFIKWQDNANNNNNNDHNGVIHSLTLNILALIITIIITHVAASTTSIPSKAATERIDETSALTITIFVVDGDFTTNTIRKQRNTKKYIHKQQCTKHCICFCGVLFFVVGYFELT